MNNLIKQINGLKNSFISKIVNKRLKEFKELGTKQDKEWFSELCFCILTANSKAGTAINIQRDLGAKGFLCKSKSAISNCIRINKHRFHNNKALYIVQARKHKKIKTILKKEKDPRAWLVNNIKGLGWKESSHFLRNTGHQNYAILDRHIIKLMHEHNYINQLPKTLSRNTYLDIEKKFKNIANKLNISPAKLDLFMWYLKTGNVLK